jgi:hypothetical protein
MDKLFESMDEGGALPLITRLEIAVHLFFCPECAAELERFETVQDILKTDFFPPSPDLEETIMGQIRTETSVLADEPASESPDGSAGFSFRGWIITGFVVLVSLSTAFFGMDFERIVASEGSSFLLPLGITIGVVVTCYGALFIGSHLKKLSERFRLR